MSLERPPAFKFDAAELFCAFRGTYLANALVAFLFAASAPVAIVLTAGQKGGLDEAAIASWLFGCFFINGLISLLFCLVYRQPLVFFWTIPGTVLVGQALDHLNFAQVVGAFYATGALMLALGLSGLIRKCMDRLPMPIIMAMVAGVFLPFVLNLIFAIRNGFLIAAPMTFAFLLLSATPRLGRVLPPLIGALIVGVLAIALVGEFTWPATLGFGLARPQLQVPEFSWAAMVELVLPLAVTVIAAQNAQGIAALEVAGHKPPVNAVTAVCGAGSLIAASVGTVSTCLTGPVNAIISSSGHKERQYAAGVLVALLALAFGLLAAPFTRLMLALPQVFIAALAGLALLRILERAFVISFAGKFTFGAAVTFIVTVANVSIFSIGAPFWGLVAGLAASWALERADFKKPAAL